MRCERIEDLGRNPSGLAHSRKAFGAMELDDSALGFHAVVSSNVDILSHRYPNNRWGAVLRASLSAGMITHHGKGVARRAGVARALP